MAELIVSYKEPKNKFYRTINLTGILDQKLSWKAKGIQAYLRTRPEGWNVWINELESRSKDNIASLRTGLKELIDRKYLYRTTIRAGGKITKWVFISFDEPTEISNIELQNIINSYKDKILDSNFLDIENLDIENPLYSNNIDSNNIDSNNLYKEETKVSLSNKLESKTPLVLDFLNDPNICIIKFWNSLGKPLTSHRLNRPDNKVIIQTLKTLKKLRKNFSQNEMKESIRTYYELINDTKSILNAGIPGHVVGINEFFSGFSKFTSERMRKADVKNIEIESWFKECLFDKDPHTKYLDERQRVIDKYPKVTKRFKDKWAELVLGGIKPRRMPVKDENCFKLASIRTVEFFRTNKKNLNVPNSEIKNPHKLVKYVFEALENSVNGDLSKVTVGWLSSNTMFNHRLPAYLNAQAMIMN